MAKRVLILQGKIPDYRRPLFSRLAKFYDVCVVHAGQSESKENDGFTQEVVPARRVGPFQVQDMSSLQALTNNAEATVVMFDLHWLSYMRLAFLRKRPKRLIFWGLRYSPRKIANVARNFIMRRADALLLYSSEHVEQLVASGANPERIFVAPNTMDVANSADFSGEEKTALLFVGRLQERKRLELALESFSAIAPQINPQIKFEIVGDGDIRASLEALARRLNISDRVVFHGAITNESRLAEIFRRTLIYVSPGAVGLSVLHSFAYGVPVLTLRDNYHGPEFRDLVDGENGLIVDDPESFTKTLKALADKPLEAKRLGHQAYMFYSTKRKMDHMVDGFRLSIDGKI